MHALVIEDDAITAMLVEDELRDLGFSSVDIASTEAEAIESVSRRCPDLVTSDGTLAIGNGVSAVRKIQERCSVPVIFMTGDPERARRSVARAPVLGKPFTSAEFSSAVQEALTGR